MKKHENAIKMLMKNAIDTKTLYGWYEYDNGTRLMTNGHLIIKLSGATLDYVGDFQKMNDRNDNKRFIDQMNDIVELAKKGEYKTTLNIQDIKVFDRYNTDKKPFCAKYSDNGYIGFNPYYFNKLNILTGSDLITIIDSKSPFYMCGNDIECVLLPVALDKNYNADNYEQFKEELKACYIQDEADKASRKEKREAKKNAETMTEIKEGETINGFYAYLSGREYFLKTDNKRVTKKVVEHFIKAVGIVKGKNADTIEKMTTLQDNVDYTKGRIYKATLKKNTIGNYTFIDIDGDNFSYGGNIDELKDKLYIFDFDALTPITFYQDEEKTNTADTTQDTTNNAITTETMQADARQEAKQTDTTQDIAPTTQDKPQKTSKKAVSLFVVTDKPQPVKLSSVNIPTIERIPTYTQRIVSRFKPLKMQGVYKHRVADIKAFKNDCMTFVDTVSCYNDKCAIGGDMVAVNSS